MAAAPVIDGKIDTLEKQLIVAADPKERAQLMLDLSWALRNTDTSQSLHLANEALLLSLDNNYPELLVACYRNLGYCHLVLSHTEEAIQNLRNGLQAAARNYDRPAEALLFTILSFVHGQLGEYEDSVHYAGKSYAIAESTQNRPVMAEGFFALGTCNLDMGNFDQALKIFEQAEIIFKEVKDDNGQARALMGVGIVHRHFGSYGRALEYLLKAQDVFVSQKDKLNLARTKYEIGAVYQALENFEESLRAYYESLRIFEELGNRYGEATTLLNVALLFLDTGEVDECFVVLFRAQKLATDIRAKPKLCLAHKYLAESFADNNNFENAYDHHVSYHRLTEQMFTYEARAKLLNQQLSFVTEKAKSEAEILKIKNSELALKNNELERALELTNDSIAYASRIQGALLPSEQDLKKLLPNSFVYFKPRDVVSGDFYWVTEWNDYIVIAAVDCTGHGVPGAFMSVLGQSLLGQIVKEKYNYVPANILSNLDIRLTDALQNQSNVSEVYDGMEAGIVTINLEDRTMQYAGANIPLYISTGNGLITVAPTSMALGGRSRSAKVKEFQNHVIPFNSGDIIYLFSDGFRDQFGFEDDSKQKYSTKRFQRLLSQMYSVDMPKQKEMLATEFDNWRGRFKQLDDVMVVGVKF
jgi:serine phosphatase RsbU (regulator of sigma subunit)